MNELELIQSFEPIFIQAANLAADLKKEAIANNKFNSGDSDIDIVTSADLEVQEFILKKIADSDLVNCEIVAEEDTPSKNLFSKFSDYVITIDPIDGTMLYSEAKKTYTTIITLHDKKRPIYTFDYYPELKWGIKIVRDKQIFIGRTPNLNEQKFLKTITYTANGLNDPKKNVPEAYEKFIQNGYVFKNKKVISKNIGATGQFILGIVDGLYVENGSAVDCLTGLHFALANNYEIYQDIDLSKPVKSERGGEEFKGYYLAIRK